MSEKIIELFFSLFVLACCTGLADDIFNQLKLTLQSCGNGIFVPTSTITLFKCVIQNLEEGICNNNRMSLKTLQTFMYNV